MNMGETGTQYQHAIWRPYESCRGMKRVVQWIIGMNYPWGSYHEQLLGLIGMKMEFKMNFWKKKINFGKFNIGKKKKKKKGEQKWLKESSIRGGLLDTIGIHRNVNIVIGVLSLGSYMPHLADIPTFWTTFLFVFIFSIRNLKFSFLGVPTSKTMIYHSLKL